MDKIKPENLKNNNSRVFSLQNMYIPGNVPIIKENSKIVKD
jgi:hypothetical protein